MRTPAAHADCPIAVLRVSKRKYRLRFVVKRMLSLHRTGGVAASPLALDLPTVYSRGLGCPLLLQHLSPLALQHEAIHNTKYP